MVRNGLTCAVFAAYVAVTALTPSSAEAGFLTEFTGYTQMGDSSTATDVVNFAVYQNDGTDGGDWATQLGVTPTAGADLTAQYVYLYEVVNNGGANSKIGYFNVNGYDGAYSSSGYLSGTVFSDGSAVGPAGNQYLGPNPSSPPADNPTNSGPSVSGLSTPTFVAAAGAVDPAASTAGGVINSDFASFTFTSGPFTQTLTSGLFSSVLFLTSSTPPTYSEGQVLNVSNFQSSDGGIPTQAPEPATLALWGLGTVGFALVGRRRKLMSAQSLPDLVTR
ncbi:MAG TPA: PEP-CTERM sorting domain-containing protein [Pirellulales bacterium]|nr:PEP-CTERM sorting domain-containing protein [Pirellulales bacterium]